MRRFLSVFTLLLCLVVGAKAQNYKVLSMEYMPNDMTARDEMRWDDSDKTCAVIKIVTQNITPEARSGFYFESDWGSQVIHRDIKGGEIRVWVSPGLKTLIIRHEDLGSWELRVPNYGLTVEPMHTYKVVIQGTIGAGSSDGKPEATHQYLAFQITPSNAVLEVNDELWNVEQDGSSMKFVNFGTYTYRVKAPNYHSEVGEVTVNDPENTQKVIVNLKPNFIEVTLTVDADAEIWVNNEKKGVRTWKGALGKGIYKIECKQAGCETTLVTKEITSESNGKTFTLVAPRPIYGSLNVESTPSFAKVFIDGKEMGETPKFIKEIQVGKHQLKLTKDGYEKHEETVEIKKNERKQLKLALQKDAETPVTQKPTQVKPAEKKPVKSVFFVMANVAYSVAPQTSFGFTVGSARKLGWYLNLCAEKNFDSFSYDFECDEEGQISFDGNMEYQFTGDKKTPYFSAVAGMVIKISNPLYLYIGGGYGQRSLLWKFDSSTEDLSGTIHIEQYWAKNTAYSHKGLSLDGGLMFCYDELSLSVGVRTIGKDYLEAKLGIGLTINY